MLRVWLPDRPGALGLVASRIGAVRGDVLAIDILERGGGQVVDELVVSLPASTPQELLIAEVGAVDDVAVESVREAPSDRPDPALALFELGAQVAEACAGGNADPVEVLGRGISSALDADWVVVIGSRRRAVPPRCATRLPLARGVHRWKSAPSVGQQPRSRRRVVGAVAAISGAGRRRSVIPRRPRARACAAADPRPHRRPPACQRPLNG